MAQVVLLGANVGTAVTVWIVSTGIEWMSPADPRRHCLLPAHVDLAKGIGAATTSEQLDALDIPLM